LEWIKKNLHLGYHGNGYHFEFFQPLKSCHILRWIFLQSFMKFDRHDIVKNWALIISCYVLTLFVIHTTSICIVRLGDICRALRYSSQYLLIDFIHYCNLFFIWK
jgi:hypothetical protein